MLCSLSDKTIGALINMSIFAGALVANLTLLQRQRQSEPGFIEYIIIDKNAAEKFTISENGLLHTKVRVFSEFEPS